MMRLRNFLPTIQFIALLPVLAIVLCLAAPAVAQTQIIDVTVTIPVSGAVYQIDGIAYNSSQNFRWVLGSEHRIEVLQSQYLGTNANTSILNGFNDPQIGSRYRLLASDVTIQGTVPEGYYSVTTTDSSSTGQDGAFLLMKLVTYPGLKTINLNFRQEHLVRIVIPGCPRGDSACTGGPGVIIGNGVDLANSCGSSQLAYGDYWCTQGDLQILARPNAGFAFKDWNPSPAFSGGAPDQGYAIWNIANPSTMQLNFGPAKTYRLRTEPPGLDVLVDRQLYHTKVTNPEPYCSGTSPDGVTNPPTVFYENCVSWAVGSTRLLSAPTPQADATGKRWEFDQWSVGGGQNTAFVVSGSNLSLDTVTAQFIRAGNVSFLTQPQLSLPLTVNGRTWPAYNFWFGIGRDYTFSAPLETVDTNGRRWRFKAWSNGGPATQTLKVTEDMLTTTLVLTAIYEPLNKLTIETNPPGLTVAVDGKDCVTPCLVERAALESVTLSPARSVTQANVLKLEFDSWSDGVAGDRKVGFANDVTRLTANYKQSYLFTAISNPTDGATFTFNPSSPDGFYKLGTSVSVTVKAGNGYRFRRWSGDTAGLFNTATLSINGPRSVVAELETVPFLDPAAVQNSAGTGPQDKGDIGRVASGSLITIYGANLTSNEQVGPRAQWLQSLGGLVVTVADRLLPLSYVSAKQINAQLPQDLPLGRYKLTITRTGQPDVSTDFDVVRNAPGLFGQYSADTGDNPPYAFAFRADGTVVTTDAPARPNEIISLIGTGIGPFRTSPPTGFATPSGLVYTLADNVEVLVGDQVVQPLQVFATPGFVGFTSVQIRVGSQFPVGQSTSLRVRVNGKESNTVRLLVR